MRRCPARKGNLVGKAGSAWASLYVHTRQGVRHSWHHRLLARGYDRTGFFEVATGERRAWTVQLTEFYCAAGAVIRQTCAMLQPRHLATAASSRR
jgi:hypothetical protein